MLQTVYEVVGRRPRKKSGKRHNVELLAAMAESQWQFALKAARMLKKKGFQDLVVREVRVTHECTLK